MSKLTKRITAMLLSGMLVIGSATGSVYAAAADVDQGLTSEIAEEVFTEEPVETSEEPVESAQTSEVAEEVFPEEGTAENTEAPVNPDQIPEAAPQEEAVTSYTVTLDASGGFFVNEWDDSIGDYVEQAEVVVKQIPAGGTVTAVPVYAEQDGQSMVFSGWSLERDGEILSTGGEEYAPLENCVLYAVWKAGETVEETEKASWGEDDESIVEIASPMDEAQEPKAVEEAEDAVEGEESPVEEDAVPYSFDAPDIEYEQILRSDQDAVYVEEEVQETSETSLDSDVAEKETVPNVIESTDSEEKAVSEEPLKGIVDSGTCGENLTWTLDEEGTLTISGKGEITKYNPKYRDFSKFQIYNVILEEGITSIGYGAFSRCSSLESVSIPNSVKGISTSAFWSCKSLKNINIPNSVTTIGDSAFSDCECLTSVIIPQSVTSIGEFAFFDCASLIDLNVPNSVSNIGDGAFDHCSSLTSFIVPNSVTSIGLRTFRDCSSLTSITLPGNVTSIGDRAFENCRKLNSIIIPDSVTSIGVDAFLSCNNLTIYGPINSEAYRYAVENKIPFIPTDTDQCPILTQGTTDNGLIWSLDSAFTLCVSGNGEIPDSGDIAEYPWIEYKDKIRSVVLEKGITYVGSSAFFNYDSLVEVTLCDEVEILGQSAFYECSNLKYVKLPNGLKRINAGAFSECQKLTEIIIPDTVTSIGVRAFSGCRSLTTCIIGGNVTTINDYSFEYCSSLLDITIPDSVTSIGKNAFYSCSSLLTVIIGNGVTSIGNYSFEDCSNLKHVSFGAGLTSIGYSAFQQCSSLTSINIGDSVTSIGDSSFEGCSNLISATIGNGVDCIGNNTFYNCTSLSNVDIPSTVKAINDSAFFHYNRRMEQSEPIPGLTISGYTGTEAQNYSNKHNISFKSLSISIKGANITVSDQTYQNGQITPEVTVDLNGILLRDKVDYTVTYRNNTCAGTATVIITGKIKYEGTEKATFKIYKANQVIIAPDLSLTFPNGGRIATYGNKGNLTYKSSNTAIATVDSYGKVTTKGAGTAKITIIAAETDNYKETTKTINVNVAKASQSITAKATASRIAVGKTTTVSITGNKGATSFKSSDTTIATVDKSTGKVTAKKVGTVKITATSAAIANYNAASKTVTIKVVPAATASLTAANQATGIKLTWKKVTGANGYKVYRGSTLIKTITSGSTVTFADTKANTNGTKYTYKVVAKAATGDSTLSKSVAVYRVARPAISSVTNSAASKMTVKWGKNAKATGYQIQYSTDKTFKTGNKALTVAGASAVSKVIGGLTKSKTYYVRIRTYKNVGSAKYWSVWSPTKSVKIAK